MTHPPLKAAPVLGSTAGATSDRDTTKHNPPPILPIAGGGFYETRPAIQ